MGDSDKQMCKCGHTKADHNHPSGGCIGEKIKAGSFAAELHVSCDCQKFTPKKA